MIKIDFQEPTSRTWKAWKLKCESATFGLIQEFEETGSCKINDKLYKSQKARFYQHKDGPFFGKCAYCELEIGVGDHGELDHYRPKAKVTDEIDNVVNVKINDNDVPHPGYYWLAYECHNLLCSCLKCNQATTTEDGKPIGKRNRFPVDGVRATKPGEEANEVPLLLNPTVDDPAEHMKLLSPTGILVGTTERGKLSISVLGLNERGLPGKRSRAYKIFRDEINWMILDLLRKMDVSETLARIGQVMEGREEFSFTLRAAVADADDDFAGLFGRGLGYLAENVRREEPA